MSAADRAALDGFFKSRRGARSLLPTSVASLVAYFGDKGTTLAELNHARPAGQLEVDKWLDEWSDYAAAAGILDKRTQTMWSGGSTRR